MKSDRNFPCLFELTLGGPSSDFLLLFNLINDALVCGTLDRLLEQMKALYYSGDTSGESVSKRERVRQMLGFLVSELFFVILHQK